MKGGQPETNEHYSTFETRTRAWFNYPFLTSKERDNETGLDFFLARYYSNTQGRFTGVDPAAIKLRHLANPQDLNCYAYVFEQPVSVCGSKR